MCKTNFLPSLGFKPTPSCIRGKRHIARQQGLYDRAQHTKTNGEIQRKYFSAKAITRNHPAYERESRNHLELIQLANA